MKIDIIGAGSLGLLLAGKLIGAGNEIRLWCRGPEQALELSRRGLIISYEDEREPLRLAGDRFYSASIDKFAAAYTQDPGEWIIVTVKQNALHHELPEFLQQVKDAQPHIVCFQNGRGHLAFLQALLPKANIYAAVTTVGAKRASGSEVIHAGEGGIWLGKESADPSADRQGSRGEAEPEAICLIEAFSLAGFSAHLSKEVDTMIYRKLLINAVINPLTAIWRIPNGELLASEHRIHMMRALYDEAVSVYDACGIGRDSLAWDNILEVCRATSSNTSSMLADVLASRTTEIRWINGSLVEMAERSGMDIPLHRWICRMVEGMIAEER
ncbi:2-dehydropantoate 2-reductase [Paenibacillus albidus]|uniref:2-dehydropantoate 2-reductase n=1 Tax=Paenibacillus albidus TaxID=2041023 RepID=A0A917FHU6_9BACL|nr:2-dehydropantoate 2-reductase [Paenibacillus albidus]GGF77945.1 2-dehydropantoate 2-reductase [Paenibacillus albidus]